LLLKCEFALAHPVPLDLFLLGPGPIDPDGVVADVDDDMIGMRNGLGTIDAQTLTPLQILFPFELVGDRNLEPFVVQAPVVVLGCGDQLGEEALGPLVAPGSIDSKRANDCLGHGDGELALRLIDADGAIGLLEDDVLGER